VSTGIPPPLTGAQIPASAALSTDSHTRWTKGQVTFSTVDLDQHAHQNGSPRRPNAPNELKSTRTAGNLTSASAGRRLPTTRPVRRRASPRRRERVEPGLRRCRAARSHQRGQVELRQRGVGGHERELLVGHDILHARRQRVPAGRALQQQVRCRPATHVNETEDEVGRPAAAGDGALSPTRNEHLHTVASSPAREPSVPARAWAIGQAGASRASWAPAAQRVAAGVLRSTVKAVVCRRLVRRATRRKRG
jgi:hypothetical protein